MWNSLWPSQMFSTEKKKEGGSGIRSTLIWTGVGAGVAVALPHVALSAAGFTAKGIAAESTAAAMMKASAIAYGGGVPAGGLIATLQSLGATAGFSYVAAGVGGATGYLIDKFSKDKRS
ncbi:interferon alpha-inducible protein 27-like protein 2A isoform X2 [Ambystoma mexicanum]|uniref:interferon alpha-inducible protein 27-like protein 2A isoform X2 n=1 Tax=Ambystoma mexicanum TaxID=8296 RepID=UPI0037E8B250